MNDYQTKLYNELMTLTESNEAFFFNDWEFDEDTKMRNFNYRLASYSDFLEPSALECRGHMFEIDGHGNMIRLASLAPQKFFNRNENPLTMSLDLSQVVEIADKADGSLITTYMVGGVLQVKTKGSIISDQCIAANMWLHLPEQAQFRAELIKGELLGCTIILEWCAMNNRIVLSYPDPHLKVLAIRSREDGSYIHFDEVDCEHFPETLNRWTKIYDIDQTFITYEEFIDSISDMKDIEGVVFRMASGQLVKLKTAWYLNLHRNKDNVNSPKRLFEAVVYETSDDLKSLFFDDPFVIDIIVNMENHVSKIFNHIVDSTERFYERNKNLDRKDYAILGQDELPNNLFHLAMTKYLGKPVDYKSHMIKNFDNYKPDESLD